MKALIDTNVIVDVLQDREPWCAAGREVFLAVASRVIDGFITAKQAADIHYFSRKQFKGQDHVDTKARDVLAKLLTLFEVTDSLAEDCREALSLPNGDYEDALLIVNAHRAGMDCIVTRNPEHFAPCRIRVLSPEQLMAELRAG